MTPDDARNILYTAAAAAIATLVPVPAVQWDNRDLVDLETQTDPWLAVEFLITTKIQASLGSPRTDRYYGQLIFLAAVKQGQGISTSWRMVDTVARALEAKVLSGVVTEVARPQPPVEDRGWYLVPLAIPFDFQDVVAS